MKRRHVIKRFPQWSDGRVTGPERVEIQRHLEACDECRGYFDKMTRLVGAIGPDALPRLQPDPFLPSRIRAVVRAAGAAPTTATRGGRRPVFGRLAVSLMGVAVVAATAAGIVIGSGLSSQVSAGAETQAIVSGYNDAFTQDDLAEEWETVLSAAQEDKP